MTTLTIKDLSIATDLDSKALASVRGGTGYGMQQSYCSPAPWGGSQYEPAKNEFNFNAAQSLGQCQNTEVNNGNNAAFVCGITSNVTPTQNGYNSINFGH